MCQNGLEGPEELSALNHDETLFSPFAFERATLRPGRLYLGRSMERLSLPTNVFGFMHTRSRWARIGVDCLGSSYYVSPGFGGGTPLPLVLEIKVASRLIDFSADAPIGALVLFELDTNVATGTGNHYDRFPLNILARHDEE